MVTRAVEQAWQAALSAEQRAAFGYGLLGARLHGAAQLPLAVRCSDEHEALRDSTAGAIAAVGLTPVAPAADYPALYPVSTAAQAIALAPRLEDGCAAAWRYLYAVAASTPGTPARTLRANAQTALDASAVRATRWRKLSGPSTATVPFPGL